MKLLENDELMSVNGGAAKGLGYALFIGIAGFVTLLAGIISGYTNPEKCNN